MFLPAAVTISNQKGFHILVKTISYLPPVEAKLPLSGSRQTVLPLSRKLFKED